MLAEVVPLDEGDLRAVRTPLDVFRRTSRQPAFGEDRLDRERLFRRTLEADDCAKQQEPTVENRSEPHRISSGQAPELRNHTNCRAGKCTPASDSPAPAGPWPPACDRGIRGTSALRPYVAPRSQCTIRAALPLYIEPGSAMLRAPEREQAGVWKSCAGPAQPQDLGVSHLHPRPYPVNAVNSTPPTSIRSCSASLPWRTPITNRNVGGKGCKLVSHCDIGRMGGGARSLRAALCPGGSAPAC